MALAVLFLDEVEKGLSGVASSGQTDCGVSARRFGTVSSWLNDRTSDVFVIATSNDASKLPPEFSRAERSDAVYFLDLPQLAERRSTLRRTTRLVLSHRYRSRAASRTIAVESAIALSLSAATP